MKSIREAKIKGKKVLVRADLDVPLEQRAKDDGRIAVGDDFRLKMCLPTIKYLVNGGARVIVCGHLDRPGGKAVEDLRMAPVAERLEELLGVEIVYTPPHSPAPGAGSAEAPGAFPVAALTPAAGPVILLENLRFDPREKENDPQFAKELASLADLYVNESFATCHRAHTSMVGVPKLLPAYVGLRLGEEVEKLSALRENPQRPLIFIIGGAKVETKAAAVQKLSRYADKILLGGKLMFEESLEGVPNVVFPKDAVDTFDIGPESISLFKRELGNAKTVVWNGPLGKFEQPRYERGTRVLAEFLGRIDTDVVVGGGDTLAAIKKFGLREEMDFVSTGGGAMLAFLTGADLPGLQVLEN